MRARLGRRLQRGRGRRPGGTPSGADDVAVHGVAFDGGHVVGRPPPSRRRGPRSRPRLRAAGGRGPRRGPASSRGPCWTTRPRSRTATCSARSMVESRWATRRPVRPASSRPAAATTRASVTGSIRAVASSRITTRDVAHEQAGERHELLLAGRQAGPARPEPGVEPVRTVRPPRSVRPRVSTAASTSSRGRPAKSAMFSASVPARISVRWVTTPTSARSCCRSRSRTSTPPRKTCPGSGSTARESSDASVDFPEPVRPTSAQVCPAGTRQADVLRGRSVPCS